jgi:hypothetical protein
MVNIMMIPESIAKAWMQLLSRKNLKEWLEKLCSSNAACIQQLHLKKHFTCTSNIAPKPETNKLLHLNYDERLLMQSRSLPLQ